MSQRGTTSDYIKYIKTKYTNIKIMHSDSLINMHMGITRTIDKIWQNFFGKAYMLI